MQEIVFRKFSDLFGSYPIMLRSPGRINLLGEHTDYNDGFVIPAAIDKAVYIAFGESGSGQCRLFAVNFNESFSFNISGIRPAKTGWPNYIMGVVQVLIDAGFPVSGFNCVIGGDIPVGAGLSSSAAVETGIASALNHLFDFGISSERLATLAQKAENEFVGVRCGIMDQFANLFGRKNHALFIDCRTLLHSYIPLNLQDHIIVLVNTMVRHSLASSEYNIRRRQCEEAVKHYNALFGEIQSLRDVEPWMVEKQAGRMDPILWKRSHYVVSENSRVLDACNCLEKNDIEGLGTLMFATHQGLTDEYGVSCPELDFLVEEAKLLSGVSGARMMGGGFGGCTINLVKNAGREDFVRNLSHKFKAKFNTEPEFYFVKPENGTEIINPA